MFTPDFVNPVQSPEQASQYAKYARLYRTIAAVNKMDKRSDEAKRNEGLARMYERKIKDYATECELV